MHAKLHFVSNFTHNSYSRALTPHISSILYRTCIIIHICNTPAYFQIPPNTLNISQLCTTWPTIPSSPNTFPISQLFFACYTLSPNFPVFLYLIHSAPIFPIISSPGPPCPSRYPNTG